MQGYAILGAAAAHISPLNLVSPSPLDCILLLRPQVSIYGLHRSERHWRQPLDFVPERWVAGTPESEWGDAKEAWTPFGDGARKCVAYRFALLEASLALVRLYQQVRMVAVVVGVDVDVKVNMHCSLAAP